MLKKIFSKIKNTRSFTLTETIVMISIILILTGIIVVSTEASRALARDKKRIAHFAAYKVALQRYYSHHKSYPHPTNNECPYDSTKKIYTCRAETYLTMLQTEGYLDEMMADPKNSGLYVYNYNVDDKGQNFKLAVLLERDRAAMENDGGTCPKNGNTTECPTGYTALYEVYSTLGAHLAFNYFGAGGRGNLACSIKSNSCSSGEVGILKLSGLTNAHAELVTQSNYSYILCCSAPGLGVSTTQPPADTPYNLFLRLSAQTNAHVEGNNQSNYSNTVYLKRTGGTIKCSEPKSSCASDEVCVVSISGDPQNPPTNAHIGDCSVYSNKICCKAPSF